MMNKLPNIQNTVLSRTIRRIVYLCLVLSLLSVPAGEVHSAEAPIDIGSRLELFVDTYLIEDMEGGVSLKLHNPVPREVIMEFGQLGEVWEQGTSYPSLLIEDGKIRLYYSARNQAVIMPGRDNPAKVEMVAVLESTDGIHFERPSLNNIDISRWYEGLEGPNNVVIGRSRVSHNFTPFIDTRPGVPEEEKYKGIGYPSGGGGAIEGVLAVYVSPDGYNWQLLDGDAGFSGPHGDSQNLAFWDSERGFYVCYARAKPGRIRDIRRMTSQDLINWTEDEPLVYSDDRVEHLYTNSIHPYERAPHILIGFPNRFVPERTKIAGHNPGINDTVFMSSRDGIHFDRWFQAFIRPAYGEEGLSNRSYKATNGTVQTGPDELSLYWLEHNRLATNRLRRGTIRLDGFVSINSTDTVGTMTTRPLIFKGDRLIVNYASSAVGSLRFELQDEAGVPFPGFSLAESDVLFGNDVAHTVSWNEGVTDLGQLQGKAVRLKVELLDADFYSFRFQEGEPEPDLRWVDDREPKVDWQPF